LLGERIVRAVARRAADPLLSDTDAVRLVNAEGDGLPGLVVDRYGGLLVVRLGTAGMASRRELLARALRDASGAEGGLERADTAAARREGFAPNEGVLWGEPSCERIPVCERARRYLVDPRHGQKTGFYLDQRDSRDLVETLARGRRTLDLFSYTGGFAVAAARGGARSVTLVDSSADALALAREHLRMNAPEVPCDFVTADAFRFVRDDAGPFDLLVIDPPPLARRRGDVPRAARAHKDVLLFALRRAAPGALLLAFTCSHHVDAVLFRQIAFAASLDAGRPLQVLRELGAPSDHPVALDHPEGAYLKGLLLRAAD
jgi:23S rRNA (cytosine1962-C5)-methyltransferase